MELQIIVLILRIKKPPNLFPIHSFCWEEANTSVWGVSSFNLLAVGSQGDITLFEAEAEQSTPVSLLTVQKCNVDNLLEIVKGSDKSE